LYSGKCDSGQLILSKPCEGRRKQDGRLPPTAAGEDAAEVE
jgi:hypothetical protein